MKKRVIIIATAILVVVAGVIALIMCLNKKDTREFELMMETNGGVPLQWDYSIEDTSIVEFVGKRSEVPESDKDLAGGRVYEYYKFKTVKEGETTITFNYNWVTHDGVDQTIKYKVVVDSDLNSTVTEIKD